MIIVSGTIHVRRNARNEFLASSRDTMVAARKAQGCIDFVVAADPLEPDRINVYEAWDSEVALLRFRGDGPDAGLTSVILRADVRRHTVTASGPA